MAPYLFWAGTLLAALFTVTIFSLDYKQLHPAGRTFIAFLPFFLVIAAAVAKYLGI